MKPDTDFSVMRARMVERLADEGIQSQPLLAAMGAVRRHDFIDSALAPSAYEETSLPIGQGQTISKPGTVARMLDLLLQAPAARRQGLERVLEIGTGCGYQTAVLAHLARSVHSLERLRGLYHRACETLAPLRLHHVRLIWADGTPGYAKAAPYTGIIAAAGCDGIPPEWCEQLAPGGRLVAPVRAPDGTQTLVVVERTANDCTWTELEPVHFVPLKSGLE